MIKIRFLLNYKNYQVGDIIEVSNNTAFGLIDSRIAIKYIDYQTTILKAPRDKMMSTTNKKYRIK
jgi:hypothetical protein